MEYLAHHKYLVVNAIVDALGRAEGRSEELECEKETKARITGKLPKVIKGYKCRSQQPCES